MLYMLQNGGELLQVLKWQQIKTKQSHFNSIHILIFFNNSQNISYSSYKTFKKTNIGCTSENLTIGVGMAIFCCQSVKWFPNTKEHMCKRNFTSCYWAQQFVRKPFEFIQSIREQKIKDKSLQHAFSDTIIVKRLASPPNNMLQDSAFGKQQGSSAEVVKHYSRPVVTNKSLKFHW